jgi:Na+-translocating ferredoxin:NAD+ oxidoreductase RnfD subunit
MLIWAGAVLAFLILATGLPQVQASLKLTSLDLKGWLLALGIPFVTIFWMELIKAVRHHHSGSAREGNVTLRL